VSATSFNEYADQIVEVVQACVSSGLAVRHELQVDRRSPSLGRVTGSLTFKNGSELHFREFVDMNSLEPRLKYAYHYQAQDNSLIFRYDNAAHKPVLSQDEHKHTSQGIELSVAPTLRQVLDEIVDLL
jgi:hypothetical protein